MLTKAFEDTLRGAQIELYPKKQEDKVNAISTKVNTLSNSVSYFNIDRLRCFQVRATGKANKYNDYLIDNLHIGQIIRNNDDKTGNLVLMAECDDRVLAAWIKNDKMVGWKIVHADNLQSK